MATEIRKLSGFDQIRAAREFARDARQGGVGGGLGDLVVTIDGLGDYQEPSPTNLSLAARARQRLTAMRRGRR